MVLVTRPAGARTKPLRLLALPLDWRETLDDRTFRLRARIGWTLRVVFRTLALGHVVVAKNHATLGRTIPYCGSAVGRRRLTRSRNVVQPDTAHSSGRPGARRDIRL